MTATREESWPWSLAYASRRFAVHELAPAGGERHSKLAVFTPWRLRFAPGDLCTRTTRGCASRHRRVVAATVTGRGNRPPAHGCPPFEWGDLPIFRRSSAICAHMPGRFEAGTYRRRSGTSTRPCERRRSCGSGREHGSRRSGKCPGRSAAGEVAADSDRRAPVPVGADPGPRGDEGEPAARRDAARRCAHGSRASARRSREPLGPGRSHRDAANGPHRPGQAVPVPGHLQHRPAVPGVGHRPPP